MNTIFVMMVITQGSWWLPTTEFSSMDNCRAAAADMRVAINAAAQYQEHFKAVCVGVKK